MNGPSMEPWGTLFNTGRKEEEWDVIWYKTLQGPRLNVAYLLYYTSRLDNDNDCMLGKKKQPNICHTEENQVFVQ